MSNFRVTHLAIRNGLYYFRAALPSWFALRVGRRELKHSLRTRDPRIGRIRCRALSWWFDQLLSSLETMPGITRGQIEGVVRDHFTEEMSRAVEMVMLLPTDATLDLDAEIASLRQSRNAVCPNIGRRLYDHSCRHTARELLTRHGHAIPPEASEEFDQLCHGILRAKAERLRITAAMLEGRYDLVGPQDPLFKGMDLPPPPPIPGEPQTTTATTVRDLSEKYLVHKSAHDWVLKTRRDNERVLTWFAEISGPEKPIKAVNTDDVRAFRDMLLRLPANYAKAKKFEGKTLKQVLDLAGDAEPLSLKTARKYFENLKSFLNWCLTEGYLEKSPAGKLKIGSKTNALDARLPFSKEQLGKFFGSPQYTGHKSPACRTQPGSIIVRDGKYWIPIVGLFTGMRLGEIVQLHCSDVKQGGGIWYIDVTKGEADEKQLKTPSSERTIPVHPLLLQLGFLKHVEEARLTNSAGRIFADVEAGVDGYFSHNFSKYFSRYSKQVGVKTPKTAFHSFRHNFKDALVKANVSDSRIKALLGHADQSVTASYGSKIAPQILWEDLSKVTFEVDFAHLLPSSAQ